jgi:hypothetical protein
MNRATLTKPKLPPQKETALCKQILSHLTLRFAGCLMLWRQNSGAFKTDAGHYVRFGESGQPDLMGILCVEGVGRFVGIEVKRVGGKPTLNQIAWHAEAREHGALVGVVYSVAEAEALIKEALL